MKRMFVASRYYTDDLPKWIHFQNEKLSKESTVAAYTLLKHPAQIEDIGMLGGRAALEKIALERAIRVL